MKPLTILSLAIALSATGVSAGPLTEAKINRIVNDVTVVDPATGSHAAALQEVIKDEVGVKTGLKSRSELLFQDETLTRVGPESYFSFKPGTREMALEKGTMLLQVPKGLGGARIRTAAVTAAITGTTIMLENVPGQDIKVLVLEGSLRLSVNGVRGDSLLLLPGKMVIMPPNAKRIPEPVSVDLARVMKTSSLVKMGQKGKDLPSLALIENEIKTQAQQKAANGLVETNLVIAGSGNRTLVASNDILSHLDREGGMKEVMRASRERGNTPEPTPGPTPVSTPKPGPTPQPGPTPVATPTPQPSVPPLDDEEDEGSEMKKKKHKKAKEARIAESPASLLASTSGKKPGPVSARGSVTVKTSEDLLKLMNKTGTTGESVTKLNPGAAKVRSKGKTGEKTAAPATRPASKSGLTRERSKAPPVPDFTTASAEPTNTTNPLRQLRNSA